MRMGPPLVGVLVSVVAVMQAVLGHAQVTTNITSSGLGTTISPNGTTVQITGGTRSGANLFHSFGQFNVGAGDTASFVNTTPAIATQNLLGRVTGGVQSSVFGAIDTLSYSGANLFLINPAGWVFGPTATLNVAGSFHVSSADSIRFPDFGGQPVFFNADPSRPSVLSAASPIAFGFLGPTAAPISIQGSTLQVPAGATLSIVGGDVSVGPSGDIRSFLDAPGGRVQIASVASAGEATFGPLGEISIAPGVPRGSIEISSSDINAGDFSGLPGGAISIIGGRLVMDRSSASINTVSLDPGLQPGIRLQATDDIVISNGSAIGTATFGEAAAADVDVSGQNVSIETGSVVFSRTFSAGPGGEIRVTATGAVEISGRDEFFNPSAIVSEVFGEPGAGGRVFISAPTVTLDDGGAIRTTIFASGQGGDVVVQAGSLRLTGDAEIFSNSSTGRGGNVSLTADSISLSGGPLTRIVSTGSAPFDAPPDVLFAGDIVLQAGTISLDGGAQIQSGALFLDAGNVTLDASSSISISSGSRLSSQAFARTAGPVRISAPLLSVDDAVIDTSTLGVGDAASVSIDVGTLNLTNGGKVVSSTLADGRGGNVKIAASDSLSISGASSTGLATVEFISDLRSGVFSEAQASSLGPGGNITAGARDLTLQAGGVLSTSSFGVGNAGNIALVVGETLRIDGGVIATAATQADGGNISIATTGSLLHMTNGQITTSVQSGTGAGGNITIGSAAHPVEFVVLNDSQIRADAFGGPGGNVAIFADVYLTSGSIVSASSALGVPGTISIEAGITDVSGSIAQLPEAMFQATTLLRAACATRMAGGQSSSLVVGGRGGLPAEPGTALASSLIAEGPAETLRGETPTSIPMWAFEPRCLR